MPYHISDGKLDRQIAHLTQHLPSNDELKGERQGSSYYRKTNDKHFINAHRVAYGHLQGLEDKFQLTQDQKHRVDRQCKDLLKQVEHAFSDYKNPPANLDDFLQRRKA